MTRVWVKGQFKKRLNRVGYWQPRVGLVIKQVIKQQFNETLHIYDLLRQWYWPRETIWQKCLRVIWRFHEEAWPSWRIPRTTLSTSTWTWLVGVMDQVDLGGRGLSRSWVRKKCCQTRVGPRSGLSWLHPQWAPCKVMVPAMPRLSAVLQVRLETSKTSTLISPLEKRQS